MGFGTLLEDEVRKIVEEKNERDEDEAAIVKRNFWRVSFATTYQYRYPDGGLLGPLKRRRTHEELEISKGCVYTTFEFVILYNG